MGLRPKFIKLLREYKPKGIGAALGYPDIILKPRVRTPSEALWKELGVEVQIFDVEKLRGMEKILDLNIPLFPDLYHKYDFLINPGTYEHCFNIGQAMWNGYKLVKPGGLAFHTGPIARGKHGFWNFNKNTFSDFYTNAGGQILHQEIDLGTLYVVTRNGPEGNITWPHEKRKR